MDDESGFTLVELLVVIAIIGILGAIGLSAFREYKGKSYDAYAISDLKHVISAEEVHYVDNDNYTDDIAALDAHASLSDGVVMQLALPFGDPADGWTAVSYHPNGKYTYCFTTVTNEITVVLGVGAACP